MARTKVAVLSTTPETVLEDTQRALIMSGASVHLGADAVIKLDLGWNRGFPGTGTQPWQLDGVLRALDRHHVGAERIQVVETPRQGLDPQAAARAHRLDVVLRGAGLQLAVPSAASCPPRSIETEHVNLRQHFPRGLPLPLGVEGKTTILLPSLKTHRGVGVGGAVLALASLLMGDVPEDAAFERIAPEVLAVARDALGPILVLMDGTVCGDGAGPRTVHPSLQNVLIASTDPAAVDAVAAQLMGLDPRSLPWLREIGRSGQGNVDLDTMELCGEDLRGVDFGFRVARNLSNAVEDRPRRWWARPELARAYENLFWCPFVGSGLLRQFRRTPWGRLMAHYESKAQ